MADARQATTLLAGRDLSIGVRAPFARVALRGHGDDVRFRQAVESVAGVAPPLVAGHAATGLLATLLWLGPDEWLLASETQEGADLVVRLRNAFKGMAAAATDLSDARVVFSLTGIRARDVLAKGCSIDLHPRAFGQGRCAQSLLAKAAVIVHQRGPEPAFDLYVARSFAEYVQAWLLEAGREYG